jgi:hypothetical protein
MASNDEDKALPFIAEPHRASCDVLESIVAPDAKADPSPDFPIALSAVPGGFSPPFVFP